MPHRFTALVLAFIIGGPVCCCGWVHGPEVAEKTAEKSCCHPKEDKGAAEGRKDKDCACAKTPKVRDLVQSEVQVPQPEASTLDAPLWVAIEPTLPRDLKKLAAIVLPEHGPPRSAEPLYLSHHALLI